MATPRNGPGDPYDPLLRTPATTEESEGQSSAAADAQAKVPQSPLTLKAAQAPDSGPGDPHDP